ncbi:hypothetical protein PAAG_12051 [Paracoccidioides lutzii Pb01]|uniref:Uncharacterized protein n=1 Tax=Paracoccidioides lutzii (strain ATCC MYA-826 / Pb01) TaxID=502779 RepID=A0A0A2V566_PARBA|nr:hypothetical protein PAAG_12051 [Paracoccidioides lutzii Pb01]KGQ01280.1 hypothetical protein PAAG_12051 [Paracoccidioides lutzii Pb01]
MEGLRESTHRESPPRADEWSEVLMAFNTAPADPLAKYRRTTRKSPVEAPQALQDNAGLQGLLLPGPNIAIPAQLNTAATISPAVHVSLKDGAS